MSILKSIYDYSNSNPNCCYTDILGRNNDCSFTWNDGVSIAIIEEKENQNNIMLPLEYKQFLTYSNGAKIFVEDNGNAGYELLSLDNIISETKLMRDCGYPIEENELIFMRMLYSGNFMLFDYNNRIITYCDAEYDKEEWVQMHTNFDDFILRLFWANGNPFWEWY